MSLQETNKTEQQELLQLVSFKIGEEEFGVDILVVQEINKMLPITKVPNLSLIHISEPTRPY